MRRRATLALLASALAGAAGCAGTPGDEGSTSTPTPTEAPTATGTGPGTDAATDTRSVTLDDKSTPSGTPPASVGPSPGSCEPDRPTPDGTGGHDPMGHPAPPDEPTGDDARDYLVLFETASHANRLVVEGSSPEGIVVADVTLDGRVGRVREGPDWTLAGVATDGSVGYEPAPTGEGGEAGDGSENGNGTGNRSRSDGTVTGSARTRTPTSTPVPGITVHSRASYYLTDGFLVRQDRGHDGEPPAAVSAGTVVACFD